MNQKHVSPLRGQATDHTRVMARRKLASLRVGLQRRRSQTSSSRFLTYRKGVDFGLRTVLR